MPRHGRQMLDHDGEPLLTVAQAAARLGTNTETVRRWIRKGAVPFLEIGPFRRKRLRQNVVDAQRRHAGAA